MNIVHYSVTHAGGWRLHDMSGVDVAQCDACGSAGEAGDVLCRQCGAALNHRAAVAGDVEHSGTVNEATRGEDDVTAKPDVDDAKLRALTAAPANSDVPEPSPKLVAMPPKRTLLDRPWTSDWVFWVVVGFAVLGVQSVYRTGQAYLFTDGAALLIAGTIDIVVWMLIPILIIGLPAVAIRSAIRRSSDKKALAIIPSDTGAGWKPDPLDTRKQRWWSGDRWTRATNPEQSTRVGSISWWVIAGVFVVLATAFLIGRASDPGPSNQQSLESILEQGLTPEDAEQLGDTFEDSSGGSDSNEPPVGVSDNPQIAVAVYFNDLVTAITDYTQVPANVENPVIPIIEQRQYLDDVVINYEGFSASLEAIANQEQLGGENAPDLEALREFSDAVRPYLQVRLDLYDQLEACGPLTVEREWGSCEFGALADAEQPLLNTVSAVVEAYENVEATIPPV